MMDNRIPKYIQDITEIKLTMSGKIDLCGFTQTVLEKALKEIANKTRLTNPFLVLVKEAHNISRAYNMKYDRVKVGKLFDLYQVDPNAPKFESNSKKANNPDHLSVGYDSNKTWDAPEYTAEDPMAAAENVILGLKASNFEMKCKLGLDKLNPWWSLCTGDQQLELLRKYPWYLKHIKHTINSEFPKVPAGSATTASKTTHNNTNIDLSGALESFSRLIQRNAQDAQTENPYNQAEEFDENPTSNKVYKPVTE